ncbi:outer membrane beta-barrel protein [Paucibacter sediminis]|uniref:Outer membrane beta-barrel protein n=1 Tax=Paucibacter sediminis TaxID=3019553 RepID=A0AA95NF24_9BURK|nr:OmpW family outer membrane protein [Paucibacter sp. S2-9]WIT14085.1 outer membrane beta-barrel protein [Paucibacter sp. S2-9]
MMGKIASTFAAVALAAASFAAQAQAEGPWLVRARVVNIDSANKDTTGLGLTINNKAIPEVDISYFFSPNIAAELILTYPQKHTLKAGGAEIGSLKHLPPTLSLQYHFAPAASFRPYVGVGLNYTNFSSVKFAPAVETALHPSIKHNSFGLSAQIGADIELSKNLYLNVDVKKVQIGTKVYSSGTEVGKFKVDPLLVGVGLGMRF